MNNKLPITILSLIIMFLCVTPVESLTQSTNTISSNGRVKNQETAMPQDQHTNTKYGIWCRLSDYTDNPSLFIERIRQGKFDRILFSAALIVIEDGTQFRTTLGFTRTAAEQFKAQVRTVNPNMEFYAVIEDGHSGVYADFHNEERRETFVNNLYAWFTSEEWAGCWDGVDDDCENFRFRCPNCGAPRTTSPDANFRITCESCNHKYYTWETAMLRQHYFTLAYQRLNHILPFYAFSSADRILDTECKNHDIGPYTNSWTNSVTGVCTYYDHSFNEADWKECWDATETYTIKHFGTQGKYWISLYSCSHPEIGKPNELARQLPWLTEKLNQKTWPYLEAINLWWYKHTTQDDWNAWIKWVNENAN
jgi:hypothetical protein